MQIRVQKGNCKYTDKTWQNVEASKEKPQGSKIEQNRAQDETCKDARQRKWNKQGMKLEYLEYLRTPKGTSEGSHKKRFELCAKFPTIKDIK